MSDPHHPVFLWTENLSDEKMAEEELVLISREIRGFKEWFSKIHWGGSPTIEVNFPFCSLKRTEKDPNFLFRMKNKNQSLFFTENFAEKTFKFSGTKFKKIKNYLKQLAQLRFIYSFLFIVICLLQSHFYQFLLLKSLETFNFQPGQHEVKREFLMSFNII